MGRSPYDAAVKKYFSWSMFIALTLSLLTAGVSYIFLGVILDYYNEQSLQALMPGFLLATPGFTLAFVCSGMLKGIKKPARSVLAENGVISIVTAILLLAVSRGIYDDISVLGYCYAASAWIVLCWTLYSIYKWFKNQHKIREKNTGSAVSFAEYFSSSTNFFFLSATMLVQQVFSVMIASAFISVEEIGYFRAAERTALLVGFVQVVINAVYPARFAKAYHENKINNLVYLSRQSASVAVVLCFPLLLLCVIFPEYVLSLFGSGFQGAVPVLMVIAVAQGVNVSLGSVSYMLQMTGHGATARNIAFFSSAVSLLLYFLLGESMGLMGIAYAFSAGIVLLNVLNAVMVKRLLGFWIYPSFEYRKKNA